MVIGHGHILSCMIKYGLICLCMSCIKNLGKIGNVDDLGNKLVSKICKIEIDITEKIVK